MARMAGFSPGTSPPPVRIAIVFLELMAPFPHLQQLDTNDGCHSSSCGRQLPIRRLVILEELPPDVFSRVDPRDDRIDDARRAIHDVQRRMEPLLDRLS